jgi:hypothetical protein
MLHELKWEPGERYLSGITAARLQHRNTRVGAPSYLACAKRRITGMTVTEHLLELERRLSAGEAFVEIEDWVQDIRASDDVKAALWLFAWTEQERATQRRVVYEALGHLADSGA